MKASIVMLFMIISVCCCLLSGNKKNKIDSIQKEIEIEKKKIEILNQKLRICDNRSSFFELKVKSDPVFKAMVYGYPVPRLTSYMGDKGESKNNDSKYKVWEQCPPGCIAGVY